MYIPPMPIVQRIIDFETTVPQWTNWVYVHIWYDNGKKIYWKSHHILDFYLQRERNCTLRFIRFTKDIIPAKFKNLPIKEVHTYDYPENQTVAIHITINSRLLSNEERMQLL